MKFLKGKISDYEQTRGWITGSFFPTDLLTHDKDVEIKVDHFKTVTSFSKHYHSKRKTWTIVLQGAMHMKINDEPMTISKGEFIILEPGVTEELFSTDPDTIAVSLHTPSLNHSDKVDIA